MSAGSATLGSLRLRRPEWILAVLAVLTFALIPVQVNTIYGGLPAHPLFVHVPVILIPLAVVAALALAARPALVARHGIWVGLVAVVALGALNLTMGAGNQLRSDLGLTGGFGPAQLIARHAHAASILRVLFIVFTAVLLVAVAVFRTRDRRVTGIGVVDRLLDGVRSAAPLSAALRVLVVVLALACAYFVFHVGDLGAQAVWKGRISAHGGFPGGAPTGSGGAPTG